MAFTDRGRDEHTISKIVAVSTIHAVVIYGLVTGLGVRYISEVIPNLPTKNYPSDPPKAPQNDPPKPRGTVRFLDQPPLPPSPLPDLGVGVAAFSFPPIPDERNAILLPTPPRPPVGPSFAPKRPRPRNDPGAWVLTSDYPPRDIREGNEGTTRILLSVDADGKVQDCRIGDTSGHESLDDAACKAVTRRARFEPARNGNDEKVAGIYSNSVRWVIPRN